MLAGSPLVALALAILSRPSPAAGVPQLSGVPAAATVWRCDAARSAAQRWLAPVAGGTPSALVLAANASGFALQILGWPAFAHNTPLATYAPERPEPVLCADIVANQRRNKNKGDVRVHSDKGARARVF